MKTPYIPGPVDDYDEMHRKLSPEENAAEYAYWSKWLEAQKTAKATRSSSGMTPLNIQLPKPPGGKDE
jgi:hypothetical protein